MEYRVDLTIRAARDLLRLYLKINATHSKAAQDWFNGLEAAIMGLSDFPARHPVAPEDSKMRQVLFPSQSYVYRVIFSVDEPRKTVTVLHIRHGARERG